MNENAEIRKLSRVIAHKNQQLEEATKIVEKSQQIVESKEKEIRIIKESNQRTAAMEELLAPLNEEKQEVMRNLLESVREVTGDKTVKAAEEEDRSNVIDIKRLAGL